MSHRSQLRWVCDENVIGVQEDYFWFDVVGCKELSHCSNLTAALEVLLAMLLFYRWFKNTIPLMKNSCATQLYTFVCYDQYSLLLLNVRD